MDTFFFVFGVLFGLAVVIAGWAIVTGEAPAFRQSFGSRGRLFGSKFSDLRVGPFDAGLSRQAVARPGGDSLNSFAVATIFSARILPVRSFSFQIDFSQKYSFLAAGAQPSEFYRTLQVNCAEPELIALFHSERFPAITLFTALAGEGGLDDFLAEAARSFRRCARAFQLNAVEWRQSAVDFGWWGD